MKLTPTIMKILDKHSIKYKAQRSVAGANNASRQAFSEWCSVNGFERVGAKNAFIHDGKIYGFSVVSGDIAECRQFGENYSGLVCKFPSGKVKWYTKDQLTVQSVTRVGADGIKYMNAFVG